MAERMGFKHVASGPMVRSSYHADEFHPPAMRQIKLMQGKEREGGGKKLRGPGGLAN